jgi:hypothetical protein
MDYGDTPVTPLYRGPTNEPRFGLSPRLRAARFLAPNRLIIRRQRIVLSRGRPGGLRSRETAVEAYAAADRAPVGACFGRFVVPGLASRRPAHAASRMKARTAGVSA